MDGVEDLEDGVRFALGLEDRNLGLALGPQDRRLLVALGGEDLGLLDACGKKGTIPLCRQRRVFFATGGA